MIRSPKTHVLMALVSGLSLSVAACSSGDTTAMNKPKAATGASLDAGVASTTDAGVGVRNPPPGNGSGNGSGSGSGAPAPCSPITGRGCANANEICVLQIGSDQGDCVAVSNPKNFEEACNPNNQECGPGLVCGQVQGEPGPTCKKVCDAHTQQGCETVRGSAQSYMCALLPQNATEFAICAAAATPCEPSNDTCPMDEVCSITSQTTTGCLPAGGAQIGEDCGETGNCARGGICVNLGGGPKCYDPCDPSDSANPGCTASNGVCTGLQGLSWGICFVPECAPVSDPCANGQTCSAISGSTSCVPAGSTPIGGNCSRNACTAEGFCVNVGMGPLCYETCTEMQPCSTGQCGMLQGLDYGICVR